MSVTIPFRIFFIVCIFLLTITGWAQELWLEPTRFFIEPGTAVYLRRLTGEEFRGSNWPGKSNRVVRFLHAAPNLAPTDLLTRATATDTLATTLSLSQQGTHLFALVTNEVTVTLPASEFTAYLKKAGLEHIVALREQRGQATAPGREAYRRCAKTFVQVGPRQTADTTRTWAKPIGLPLELVLEQNPYWLAPTNSLTVQVLANGRPIAGQQVLFWYRGASPRTLVSKLRSNQNGRVLFRISGPGEYLVSTIQMLAKPSGQDVDWQSTWSTLTFGVRNQKLR